MQGEDWKPSVTPDDLVGNRVQCTYCGVEGVANGDMKVHDRELSRISGDPDREHVRTYNYLFRCINEAGCSDRSPTKSSPATKRKS